NQAMEGLRRFVELVDDRTQFERTGKGDVTSRAHKRTELPDQIDESFFEIISEFHIARDLFFAQLPTDDENPAARRDAPDLVLVLGDELIVVEAKFFSRWTVAGVVDQMTSQRRQIVHLFAARP